MRDKSYLERAMGIKPTALCLGRTLVPALASRASLINRSYRLLIIRRISLQHEWLCGPLGPTAR